MALSDSIGMESYPAARVQGGRLMSKGSSVVSVSQKLAQLLVTGASAHSQSAPRK